MKTFIFKCLLLFLFFPQEGSCTDTIILSGPAIVFDQALPNKTRTGIEKALNISLQRQPTSSLTGFQNLIQFKSNVCIMSEEYEQVCSLLSEMNIDFFKDDFEAVDFAKTRLIIIVHPTNTIQSLSKEQLRQIFSGKIKNWKDVGGDDLPIMIYVEAPRMGIRTILEENLFKTDEYITERSYTVTIPEGLMTGVRDHEGAISYYVVLNHIAMLGSKDTLLKGVKIVKVKGLDQNAKKLSIIYRKADKNKLDELLKKLHASVS